MGGTTLRNLIASGDKETFMNKLPKHLSDKEKEMSWYLVTSSTMEALDHFIDNKIAEISSMGGGSVSGYAGGFGPPNNFNPYRKSRKPKVKKPSIKRAKRQRRR